MRKNFNRKNFKLKFLTLNFVTCSDIHVYNYNYNYNIYLNTHVRATDITVHIKRFSCFVRLNFTLEALEVVCPAYDFFVAKLKEMEISHAPINAEKVSTTFPQYFGYKRVKELVSMFIKWPGCAS